MNDASLGTALSLHYKMLGEQVRTGLSWPSPEAGLACYVTGKGGIFKELGIEIPSDHATYFSRFDEAPVLACYGYLSSLFPEIKAKVCDQWRKGYSRLKSREALPKDRESFAYRPYELLGIVMGAIACDLNTEWLKPVVYEVVERKKHDEPITQIICVCAGELIGANADISISGSFEKCSIGDLAAALWTQREFPRVFSKIGKESDLPRLRGALVGRTLIEGHPLRDIVSACIVMVELSSTVREWARISYTQRNGEPSTRPGTLALLRAICDNFPRYARQMRIRQRNRKPFDINDEYDVQDTFHAILSLFIDDIRPEEWTPKYAGNASRIDFVLKRERVIVETKMTRDGLGQKDVADQLIIDKERYKSHPDCDTLFCFVYDPNHKCQSPVALEDDISENDKVVVIVSPK